MEKIKKLQKTIVCIILLQIAIGLCIGGFFFFKTMWEIYKRSIYTESLSPECQLVYNGDIRVQRKVDGKYTTPSLTSVWSIPTKDTLTVFSKNNKRGYLNIHTGQIVIQAKYEYAWQFSEGLAGVVKNGKVGFINSKDEIVIPFEIPYIDCFGTPVDYLFKGGYCPIVRNDGKQGLIDKTGRLVFPQKYDLIVTTRQGFHIVFLNEKRGVIDSSFKWVLPLEYDHIVVSKECFIVTAKGEKQGIAFDGKTVIHPILYDGVEHFINDDADSYDYNCEKKPKVILSSYLKYHINEKWGLMNKDGERVTKAIYKNIEALSNELFCCELECGEQILINAKGIIVAMDSSTAKTVDE